MATSAEELTECSVCFETFTDPQVLTCQHTFCKRCVGRIADAGTVRCPTCKTVSMTEEIKPDFRLAQFLYVLAKQAEDLTKAASPAERNMSSKKKCELCNRDEVEFWCDDCKQWICRTCKSVHIKLVSDAKKHKIVTLSSKVQEAKSGLKAQQKELSSAVDGLDITRQILASAVQQIGENKDRSLAKCEEIRASCHATIDKNIDDLKMQIKTRLNENSRKYEDQLKNINQNIQSLRQQKTELEVELASQDPEKFFQSVATSDRTRQIIDKSQHVVQIPLIQIQNASVEKLPNWENLEVATVTWKVETLGTAHGVQCPVCSDGLQHPVTLEKCKHAVCKRCYNKNVNKRVTCGICGVENGPLKGPQPDDGTAEQKPLLYWQEAAIIVYTFPSGIQSEQHPEPGQPYSGAEHTAWLRRYDDLPRRMKQAFDARVLFTVGRSERAGGEYTVVWNGITPPISEYECHTRKNWKLLRQQLTAKGIE